jgi:tetratricopeptide (TPR) repeat protein
MSEYQRLSVHLPTFGRQPLNDSEAEKMNYSRDFRAPPPDDQVVLASLADSQPSSAPPSSSRWPGRLVILATIAIVLLPVLYLGLPGEISDWYVAAAAECRLNGDRTEAERNLDRALAWDPTNATVFHYRGDWKVQDGSYAEGLKNYERALELDAGNTTVRVQRTLAWQFLGEHEKAIAEWRRLVAEYPAAAPDQRATLLNGLAYAQALEGQRELTDALQNIEQAFQQAGNRLSLGNRAAMLDTRGYIHYLRGDRVAAERDLKTAVEAAEADLTRLIQRKDYVDQRDFLQQQKDANKSVAVIRYHRALVYQALGKHEEAERDLKRVRALGHEPGEKLF